MQFHSAAAIFPLMEGKEFDELVESIRRNGLRESIKTHDGKILDGRNRMTACTLAGIEPRFEPAEVNGSIVDYVYDLNYPRRHLTDGAKALAAARYKDEAAKEAKERMSAGGGDKKSKHAKSGVATVPPPIEKAGKARDVAGQKYGVSGKTVDRAEKVTKQAAPEVIKAVERGEIKVSTAARLADAPKAAQVEAIKQGPAAVRRTIEQHAPSPSEEARNDAGVQWHRAMRQVRGILSGVRDAGGVDDLCRRWTREYAEECVGDLSEMIEELNQWKKALTQRLSTR